MEAHIDHFGTVRRGAIVVSVPHAGRDYPDDVVAQLAVDMRVVRTLEDRYADAIAVAGVDAGWRVVIARTPRLVIDLNRAECDYDSAMLADEPDRQSFPTARAKSGLGLIPHKLAMTGPLWLRKIESSDLERRVEAFHRPYHAALAAALDEAHQLHGVAVLIDLHSMPPLIGSERVDLVIGDRFGQTANGPILAAIDRTVRNHGLHPVFNMPYAGGHIIERHAQPALGIFAVQLEIDRRLYLDRAMDKPSDAVTHISAIIEKVVASVNEVVCDRRTLMAAE